MKKDVERDKTVSLTSSSTFEMFDEQRNAYVKAIEITRYREEIRETKTSRLEELRRVKAGDIRARQAISSRAVSAF
jgi:uncharacterized membrane protein